MAGFATDLVKGSNGRDFHICADLVNLRDYERECEWMGKREGDRAIDHFGAASGGIYVL